SERCTLSLHDALPICVERRPVRRQRHDESKLLPSKMTREIRLHFCWQSRGQIGRCPLDADTVVDPLQQFDTRVYERAVRHDGERSEEHTSELQSRGHL